MQSGSKFYALNLKTVLPLSYHPYYHLFTTPPPFAREVTGLKMERGENDEFILGNSESEVTKLKCLTTYLMYYSGVQEKGLSLRFLSH